MKKRIAAAALTLALTLSIPAMGAELNTVTGPGPAELPLSVEVEGTALDTTGKSPYMEGEIAMVPVRAVAEALGYTVVWTAEQADKVRLDNGTVKTTLTLGEDLYFMASSTAIGMSKPSPLGAAPVAVNGVTYVPAALFALLGNGAAQKEQTITFTKEAEGMAQIPNPMKEYPTSEEALVASGLTRADAPYTLIPMTHAEVRYYAIGGDLYEELYRNGDDRIICRAAKGDKDISGDYTVYAETKTETINGLTVTTKGNGGLISLATWTKGECSYSLGMDTPIALSQLTTMLGG